MSLGYLQICSCQALINVPRFTTHGVSACIKGAERRYTLPSADAQTVTVPSPRDKRRCGPVAADSRQVSEPPPPPPRSPASVESPAHPTVCTWALPENFLLHAQRACKRRTAARPQGRSVCCRRSNAATSHVCSGSRTGRSRCSAVRPTPPASVVRCRRVIATCLAHLWPARRPRLCKDAIAMGVAAHQAGNYEEAIALYNRALELPGSGAYRLSGTQLICRHVIVALRRSWTGTSRPATTLCGASWKDCGAMARLRGHA